MRSSRQFVPIFTTLFLAVAAAQAAKVDMTDPRRAVGREDDIRVDAQIAQDSVGRNTPLSVTFQICNLTNAPIAFADHESVISYDLESQTITVSVGAEIPDANLPHIVIIPAGEKKTFTAGGLVHIPPPTRRGGLTAPPRYVQLKVNVLRDVAPFRELIARQERSATPIALGNDLFDKWVESNDAIFLNTLPVQWSGGSASGMDMSADQKEPVEKPSGMW